MRVLVVTSRFGNDLLGGAEKLAWEISHRLKHTFEIEVLTTCARNYRTWGNYYPAGMSRSEGLVLFRFPVTRERQWERFGLLSSLVFRWNRAVRVPGFIERMWVKSQGPHCPELIGHLKDVYCRFDRILFITYLYYPTVAGIPQVRDKAVLIPTAHNEPALKFRIYEPVFKLPRAMIFLSKEERDLVHSNFCNHQIPYKVAGVGVEDQPLGEPEGDYFLYAGRIELGKNCPEMFDFCEKAGIRLKTIGSSQITIPPHVEYLGFVNEKVKRELLSRCKAVIIPSKNESLSIAALEGWSHGKPVIVHADSPVMAGHVKRSGGGYTYRNAEEFNRVVKYLNPQKGLLGKEYVKENYSWDSLIPKFKEALIL